MGKYVCYINLKNINTYLLIIIEENGQKRLYDNLSRQEMSKKIDKLIKYGYTRANSI